MAALDCRRTIPMTPELVAYLDALVVERTSTLSQVVRQILLEAMRRDRRSLSPPPPRASERKSAEVSADHSPRRKRSPDDSGRRRDDQPHLTT